MATSRNRSWGKITAASEVWNQDEGEESNPDARRSQDPETHLPNQTRSGEIQEEQQERRQGRPHQELEPQEDLCEDHQDVRAERRGHGSTIKAPSASSTGPTIDLTEENMNGTEDVSTATSNTQADASHDNPSDWIGETYNF